MLKHRILLPSISMIFSIQPSENVCHFNTSTPLALDDIDYQYHGKLQINLGHSFITASVAVIVDSFSFIFVAFTNINGSSFVTGVSRPTVNNINNN